ncbi:hypothetical protein ACNOYE_09815 [Nannocystaceae bacterium ST9]
MDPNREPGPMPRVDERLVVPETREEMVRGRKVIATPALPPHADRHCQVDYVIRGHTAPGYVTSSDLLTRSSTGSDFATDTSVRREGIDPSTQARYLEELAFEVVFTQSLRDITERAEDLVNRGVRRMIAVFVKDGSVREWSRERNDWITLPADGVIDDPTLVRPVEVRALLDAAAADDALVDALERKGNPRLARLVDQGREAALESGRRQGLEEGRQQGHREGLEQAIEVACKLLGLPFGPSERARLEGLDATALDAVITHLATECAWPT